MGIQTEDYCTLISSIASIQLKGVVKKWQIFEEFQAWIVMTSVAALYHAPVGFLAGAVTRIQLQVGVNTRHAPVASTVGATHAHAQRVSGWWGWQGLMQVWCWLLMFNLPGLIWRTIFRYIIYHVLGVLVYYAALDY